MRWFVVVPGALVPAPLAAGLLAAADAPALAERLRRAAVAPVHALALPYEGATHLGWLWHRFSGRDGTPVTAPHAWRALGGTVKADDGAELWQADPVHFAIARDHMLVAPPDDLDADETTALAAEAAPMLLAAGAQLRILDGHWFLALEPPWSLATTPLEAALGESAQERLPQGADAARWRKLLTGIQIAWHHHPVNTARRERGAREVNGLWLHGGGSAEPLPPSGFSCVVSEDTATRGWALSSGVPPAAVHVDTDRCETDGDLLTDWRGLLPACRAEAWGEWTLAWRAFAAWFTRFADRAAERGAEVELVLCGRHHVRSLTLARGDRWRLWRGHRAAQLLAEPLAEPLAGGR